jgi:signal transduction histidine kinase/class 3 adenylate cyclase
MKRASTISGFDRRRWFAILALALLVLARPARAEAPGIVVVDAAFHSAPLGRAMALTVDATAARTLEDLRRALIADDGAVRFVRGAKDVPSFSYNDGAVWAVVRVDDRRAEPTPLVLEVDYAVLDRVDAFVVANDVVVYARAAGDHVPRAAWPRATTVPRFELPPRGAFELWLRVKSESALMIPATLRVQDAQIHEEQSRLVVYALYFGALAAMATYNLLVWASLRRRAYLFYVGFLLAYGTMQAGLNGVGFALLWTDVQPFADMVIPRFIALQGLVALFFVRELLVTARKHPRARLGAKVVGALCLAMLGLSFVVRYAPVMRATLAVIVVWAVYMIATGVAALRAGERVARFYLMAWGAFASFAALMPLVNLGVLPSTPLTRNFTMIGSVFEFLLLSFALADRMKELQGEATANAELAAANARLAQEASERSLEELRRLDRVKDEFLANTSHELRTPIHGVAGILDAMLERSTLAEADRRDVSFALGSAQRLSGLVASVLDFSLFRAGRMTLERRPTDFARIVEEEVERLRPEARVPVRVGAMARDLAVDGDGARLRQLVAQLAGNAVKFTSNGFVDIAVRVAGSEVELELRDTGPGIAPERFEHLFDGLEQGDGSVTRAAGGLGIGLALAKRVAEAHGGTLVLRSVVGEGTTVLVRLPGTREPVAAEAPAGPRAAKSADVQVARVADVELRRMASLIPPRPDTLRPSGPPAPRPARAPRVSLAPMSGRLASPRAPEVDEPPPSSSGLALETMRSDAGVRLLVADDDPMNRRVIRLQLAPLGFELVEAEDGADALAKLASEGPFDAILLDVMMPKASGYEVCRKLRETKNATELPVLMLTAKAQVRDLLEGFDAGANDYIPKPFSKAELLARIRTHVTVARTNQAMRRFLPQGALEILGHENVVDVRLGDTTERTIAVLFSDVRGFSALAEKRSPAEIFALLNQCYARIGPAVRSAGGFVDKYIGDGLMALFPSGAEAALRAAIAMQRALEEPVDGVSLRIGLGVHVGPTMLGTLGEPDRFDATVISDTVNLASRIEGASKQLGAKLLVSGATLAALPSESALDVRGIGRIVVKGREGAVEVFEVLEAELPVIAAEKRASRAAFASGLEAFVAGRWAHAQECFEAIVNACPGDAAARLYRDASAAAHAGDLRAVGGHGALVLLDK